MNFYGKIKIINSSAKKSVKGIMRASGYFTVGSLLNI